MADPNFAQQAGDFAVDAAIDTEADNLINQGLDTVAAHIPGGDMMEQQLKTEVDQVVNNAINDELNKGVAGIEQDVMGLFNRSEDQ